MVERNSLFSKKRALSYITKPLGGFLSIIYAMDKQPVAFIKKLRHKTRVSFVFTVPRLLRCSNTARTEDPSYTDSHGILLVANLKGGLIMATGTVKWFNSTKGYGFIAPDAGGSDVFVHISAVERSGLNGLNDNQKVSYELETGRDGKESAGSLKLL